MKSGKTYFQWIVLHPKMKHFFGHSVRKMAIEFATDIQDKQWDEMKAEGWKVQRVMLKL